MDYFFSPTILNGKLCGIYTTPWLPQILSDMVSILLRKWESTESWICSSYSQITWDILPQLGGSMSHSSRGQTTTFPTSQTMVPSFLCPVGLLQLQSIGTIYAA